MNARLFSIMAVGFAVLAVLTSIGALFEDDVTKTIGAILASAYLISAVICCVTASVLARIETLSSIAERALKQHFGPGYRI